MGRVFGAVLRPLVFLSALVAAVAGILIATSPIAYAQHSEKPAFLRILDDTSPFDRAYRDTDTFRQERQRIILAKAPGGWESVGGGTGVACFDSLEAAKMFDQLAKRSAPMPKELRNRITSVVTLEHWEYADQIKFSNNLTTDETLARIRAFMRWASPIFAYRLKMAAEHIPVRTWIPEARPAETVDALSVRPMTPLCRQVQLVARFTKRVEARLPVAELRYDLDLYNRMDANNQALLQLHEQVYMIAKEVNHFTSDAIRKFVAVIAAEDVLTIPMNMPGQPWRFQQRINMILGDYFLQFASSASDKFVRPPKGQYSQISRYFSFYEFLMSNREKVSRCQDERGLKAGMPKDLYHKIQMDCRDEVFGNIIRNGAESDEQAFLITARHYLDAYDLIRTSERFVIPTDDPRDLEQIRIEFGGACMAIKDKYDNIPLLKGKFGIQALRYCYDVCGPSLCR